MKIKQILKMLTENEDRWLPLIRHLLGDWLNFLGQYRFFSDLEDSIIRETARREADLLIVPVDIQMPTIELATELGIRAFPFWMFIVRGAIFDAAKQVKAKPRDNKTYYNSWVNIIWNIRIAQRLKDLLFERIRANTVAKNTISLLFANDEDAPYKSLINLILKKAKFRIPADEKESLANSLLGKWMVELRNMPFGKLCHEASYTDTVIWRDFANYLEKASYKQQQSMAALDNIAEPQAPPKSKPLPKLDEAQMNKAYGNSTDKIVGAYLKAPNATIREIAEQTGVSERTVKRRRANIRKKGKENFLDLL